MPTVLVTGAASGIGKAFVIAYLASRDTLVIAVDENLKDTPPSSEHIGVHSHGIDQYRLDVYSHKNNASGQLVTCAVDVTNESQIAQLVKQPAVCDIDVVIHSAGVRGLVPSIPIVRGSDVAKGETLDAMTAQTMQNTFDTNSVGTFLLLRALLTKLRPGGDAKVIVIGSRMGSVEHNTVGGGYAYRASKAAQNAIVKSFSVDVPNVIFVLLHPGRVESNLVGEGVKEDGAVSATESVNDMLKLLEGLRKEDSGRFMDRWGVDIPW